MTTHLPSRNIGLDLVRITESTALAASRWIGSGDYHGVHIAACQAMSNAIKELHITGQIIIGEETRIEGQALLCGGTQVGDKHKTGVDLAVDPIDGTNLLIKGRPGAISLMGTVPQGSLWSPGPAQYVDKLIVDREAADVLVPECMDAPAAWTLSLIARAKNKAVRDLTVVVLARRRHQELIDEIRATGARIFLQEEGDVEGALLAALVDTGFDILMGTGGATQGVLAAIAVKALGSKMLMRLAPNDMEEREMIEAVGLDTKKIYTCDELVKSNEIAFAATGITASPLLPGITIRGNYAHMHSLLIRSETGTRRHIHTEYLLSD
ncbi:MAG: fructose-bisphosphatase class II family protein [Anaerolineales bacterium]|nr:fructose-bisphosphatase class II family protein [Anaerolineales bacterium]